MSLALEAASVSRTETNASNLYMSLTGVDSTDLRERLHGNGIGRWSQVDWSKDTVDRLSA